MFNERKKRLIDTLKREGRIKTLEVERAFLEIPREEFVPEFLKESAYVDTPLENLCTLATDPQN